MRRVITFLLAVSMVMCLGGCGGNEETPKATTMTSSTQTTEGTTGTSAEDATTGTTETTSSSEGDVTTTTKTDAADKATTTTAKPTVTTTASTKKPTTIKPTATKTACKHATVREATCKEAPMCETCGMKVGNALGHSFVDEVCVRCGEKSPEYMSRVEVLGVELDKTVADLLIGETVKLKASLTPANATDQQVTWSSSNPAVATVSGDGVVTGVSNGDATITASSVNGKTATCKVVVGDIALQLPTLSTDDVIIDYLFTSPSNRVEYALKVLGVEHKYTQTGAGSGTLTLMFKAEMSYSSVSDPTVARLGWRLYDGNNGVVAEGISQNTQAVSVASAIPGLTAEIPNIAPGRYRLDFYHTSKR